MLLEMPTTDMSGSNYKQNEAIGISMHVYLKARVVFYTNCEM